MNQPYNFEETIDGIRLCRGNHERCEPCQFEEFISLHKYKALIIKVSELENELILRQDAVNKSQERLCELVKMKTEHAVLKARVAKLEEAIRTLDATDTAYRHTGLGDPSKAYADLLALLL